MPYGWYGYYVCIFVKLFGIYYVKLLLLRVKCLNALEILKFNLLRMLIHLIHLMLRIVINGRKHTNLAISVDGGHATVCMPNQSNTNQPRLFASPRGEIYSDLGSQRVFVIAAF